MKTLYGALTALSCVLVSQSFLCRECRAETATISGKVTEVTAQGWVIAADPNGEKLSMQREELSKGPALPMVNKGDRVMITIDTSMPPQGQQPGRVAPNASPIVPPGHKRVPGTRDDRSFYNS